MVSRVVVAALPIGLVTAPAPAMPTQDMGEQASITFNVDRNTVTQTNDGDPAVYAISGGRTYRDKGQIRAGLRNTAYPLNGGHGQTWTNPMNGASAYEIQHNIRNGFFE